MKTISFKTLALSVAGLTLAAFGASAYAASTWNFSTCNTGATGSQAVTNSGTFGNTWNCTGSVAGNSVAVTGWGGANVTGSTGFQTANVSSQGTSGFGLASRYEASIATDGLISNIGSPDHAADNAPNNSTPDMFLLHFNTAVALGKITTGWVQTDSDITLMAYGAGTPTILGKNETNITSGWSLVETSVGDGTAGERDVNAGNVVSSWWLISAYSSA